MNTGNNANQFQQPDPFQVYYRPTQPDPVFLLPKQIHGDPTMTPARFIAWKDSLPPSPIDPSVRLSISATFATMADRIAMGNRIAAHFSTRLGASEEVDEDGKEAILDQLREEYVKITFGVAETVKAKGRAAVDGKPGKKPARKSVKVDSRMLSADEDEALLTARKFKPTAIFLSYAEYVTVHTFLAQHDREKRQLAQLPGILAGIPVWDLFLSLVKGFGPQASAALLSYLNPYRAPNASSFVAYAGLDSGVDGRGRGIRKAHMEDRYYIKPGDKKAGNPELGTKSSRTYNAIMKSRLVYSGCGTMLRASLRWFDVTDAEFGSTPPHMRRIDERDERDADGKLVKKDGVKCKVLVKQAAVCDCEFVLAYLEYKHRLSHSSKMHPAENKPWKDCSDGHRDTAARRYMAKLLLIVLWKVWRKLEGLSIRDSYAVEKLGHRQHHKPSKWANVGDNMPGSPFFEK